jgi:ATP-binding cassette subfamily B protein
MSGGELQRLGLARAILVDAAVIVLDDATSSLDTATEVKVTDALERVLTGRTSLVVAHRTATAARADLVAWLDAGRVRALAPHPVLWADPDYRAVFAADEDAQDATAGSSAVREAVVADAECR